MSKLEYKLYKTKSKLSSLLVSLGPQTLLQTQQITLSPPSTQSFYILVELSSKSSEDGSFDSIWFNRNNADITYKKIKNLQEYDEITKVYGYIGKFQVNSSLSPKLLFIKKCEAIGYLRVKTEEHLIYRLKEIMILSCSPPGSFSDENESLASVDIDLFVNLKSNPADQSINQTEQPLESIKNSSSVGTLSTLTSQPQIISSNSNNDLSNQMNSNKLSANNTNLSNNTRFEKKIIDEIVKIFQDNNGSFYFSYTYDLTNSIERKQEQSELIKLDQPKFLSFWKLADERFFWNKILIDDLIDLNEDKHCKLDIVKDKFILPLIQGFVQIESFDNKLPDINYDMNADQFMQFSNSNSILLNLCIISRRSRYRLGTRFKRRGIDDNGNVANFVETEQIISVYDGHTLSFVQIRGSIPIYWSQPGIKYRPAPRIDKSSNENKTVFQKHFDLLKEKYSNQSRILIVNLVEEYGKESLLGDAYVEQLAELNRENILYVQFDFHEHWVDKKGFIYKQKTLLRVNCVDCLDRTNVVQMVLAKYVLENQLLPLGILVPSAELPMEFKKKFLLMWANNGDAISEQYAGTSALKGDYTRTGERNFAGIMKDGVKSANRYYLRFKDNFRQLAFEVLQGVKVTDEDQVPSTKTTSATSNQLLAQKPEESLLNLQSEDSLIAAEREREENVRQLVADCRRQLVDLTEDCYGSWALINYNESADINQVDPDVFLLFTSSAIYISNYDESNETFVDYQKISLKNVEKLELGPEPVSNQTAFFKSSNSVSRFYVLRIYYKLKDEILSLTSNDVSIKTETNQTESGYFHSFRSCNLRFFNNLVITTKSNEELTEALRGICHTIQSTASFFGFNIAFDELNKLIKKKSKPHQNFMRLSRLSSKMSIDNSQIQQSGSKLNIFKKMFGNKLFGKSQTNSTSSKQPQNQGDAPLINFEDNEIKPPTLEPSAATKFFLTLTPPKEENLIELSTSSTPSSINTLDNEMLKSTDQNDFLNTNSILKPEESISNDSNILNEDVQDSLIDFGENENKKKILTKTKSTSSLLSFTKTQTNSDAPKTIVSNSTKTYMPLLSTKQYLNRQQKLADVQNFVIKDSKTKYIFI